MRTFDLGHLDLVENNIPVFHSLSPEWVQKIYAKESLNVHIVKVLSIFFPMFLACFYLFTENESLHFHIEWFPWHQEPQQPQWPQQPQQPQWPQWPLQPHFIKKLTELDVSISLDAKMTYPSLLIWDGPSKIHFFIVFWHPSSWRLWRTGMLLLTKLKGPRSNFYYSEFPNHPQIKCSLNISIYQSQI